MLTLVTGGCASGKSEYAERLLVAAGGQPRIYIATMQPFDAECRARIAKHRRMRADRGFLTVERYTGLAGLSITQGASVLLECVSNLVANELYSPQGAVENTVNAVVCGVEQLAQICSHLVVVTNEVFSDGIVYDLQTQHYLRVLGEINCALARCADRVIEVVYTIPVVHKGKEGAVP